MLMAWSCSRTQLAQARVPPAVAAALALARMTALQKPDGGVRGINTCVQGVGENMGLNLCRSHSSVSTRVERPDRYGCPGGAFAHSFGDGPGCDGRDPYKCLRHSVARGPPAQATPGGPRPPTVRAFVRRAAFRLLLAGRIPDLLRHAPSGRVRTGRCPGPRTLFAGPA